MEFRESVSDDGKVIDAVFDIDGGTSIHLGMYPSVYTAYWLTDRSPLDFLAVPTRGFQSHVYQQCLVSFKDIPALVSLSIRDLLERENRGHVDILLLRLDTRHYDYIWEQQIGADGSLSTIAGMISETRAPVVMRNLYLNTAPHPSYLSVDMMAAIDRRLSVRFSSSSEARARRRTVGEL